MKDKFLEIEELSGSGYRPIVRGNNWQIAVINWEGSRTEIESLEKHESTDEAFLLIEGTVYLVIFGNNGSKFNVLLMNKNSVYDVLKDTWHAVILEGKCRVVIVEKTDTHLYDDTRRALTPDEKKRVIKSLESVCNGISSH